MQRVAIGRALVRKPSIYLMDEPLSSLDAKLRAELRLELKRIQAELGATVLYVTHDQIEAMTMADRIGILADGVLVQIGTPRDDLHRAGQSACRRPARPAGDQPAAGRACCPMPPRRRAPKTIGARTEHLTIEKSANGHADGTVDWVEHLGDQNHLHVTVKDRKLITLTDPDTPARTKGDQVTHRQLMRKPAVLRRPWRATAIRGCERQMKIGFCMLLWTTSVTQEARGAAQGHQGDRL